MSHSDHDDPARPLLRRAYAYVDGLVPRAEAERSGAPLWGRFALAQAWLAGWAAAKAGEAQVFPSPDEPTGETNR